MSIDIGLFDKARKKQSLILKFLYENQYKAFTQNEIIKNIGFDKYSIDIDEVLYDLTFAFYINSEEIDGVDYYAIAKKGIETIESK